MPHSWRTRGPVVALVVLCGFVLLSQRGATLVGANPAPALPGWALVKAERAVHEAMARQGIPGLSVAVSSEGRRWAAGFGLADVELQVPATPRTVYRYASISKTITAVAVLQLVERGLIDLDAPIQHYVPSFPAKAWPVTCRHLLGHQSGIRTYRGEEIHSTRHYHSLVDALAMFRDDPLEFEPATRFLYSTYGFNLLGAVVEGVTGSGYVSHVRRSIMEPAGMKATRDDDTEAIIPNRADGYRLGPAGSLMKSALTDVSNKVPGGGLCGTASDLVAFAEAFNHGRLLREDTMELMMRQEPMRSNRPTGYALGWYVGQHGGEREIWHTGAQPQVTTLLYIQPDQDLVVAILCNLEGAKLKELAQKLASTLSSPTPVSSPAFGTIP